MRSLRLPLGLGLAALQALAIGFLLVPLGLGALGLFIWLVWLAGDVNEVFGYIFAGIITVLGYGLVKLRRAWLYRPSDAVFREDCLMIEGGGIGGKSFEWSDIDPKTVAVHEKTDKEGKDKRWTLRIRDEELAETDDESEGASLREVATAIQSRVSPETKNENEEKPAEILKCDSCGAAVAPTGEESTTCGHCDAKVDVPKDVRERVKASATLTKKSKRAEKLVTKLLDQPGAGSTTALLWLSFLVIGSAWPVTIWAYVHLYRLQELTLLRGLALGCLPFLLIADGFFLSRLRLVDRRALGTLVMTFGAQPPARKGEPLRCRSCMGPLPASAAVVIQCIYCNASNVTGIDLRANAQRAAKSARSLWGALEQRLEDRRTWRWRTLASVPFFIAAPLLVRDAFRAQEEHWTFESLDVAGEAPRLSFDGKKILYATSSTGWSVLDLATQRTTSAKIPSDARSAAWLPDGRIIFYQDNAIRTSSGQVLVPEVSSVEALIVSADGKSFGVVASGTTVWSMGGTKGKQWELDDADFAPDGRLLGRDVEGIAYGQADGTLKHTGEEGTSPRSSPDGKRIAFFSHEDGKLSVMSSGGWKVKTLMKDCADCKDLRWGSDGMLYFVRDAGLWRGRP
jgi:hypothetical protein